MKNKDVKEDDVRIFDLMSRNADKISELPQEDFAKKLAQYVTFIKDDLGIQKHEEDKQLYAYRMSRLAQYLKRHFKDFTLKEFKEAFELYVSKKLHVPDPTKKGQQLHHYQSFSLDFITAVLTAYRNKRGQIAHKLIGLLPEQTMTGEQLEEKKQEFIDFFREFTDKVRRSLQDDAISIEDYEFFAGFRELLEANEAFKLSSDQRLRATEIAIKKLQADIREQRSQRHAAHEKLREAMKQLRDGEIPESQKERLEYFTRQAELRVFIEDAVKRGEEFTNLKYQKES